MKPPRDWKAATVADICEMRNGHGFGPDDWDVTGLPIIRIQNLNGGKKFDYYSGVPEKRWLVEPGQLLFAWAGTRGVSFGPTIWSGPVGVLNQHIFKIEAIEGIDSEWLYWALRHVTDRIEAQAHGFKATLVHVKKSDIDRQIVAIPSQAEQHRIDKILSTWDQAIATTGRLLANIRQQKDVLANSLLTGRRRLAGYTNWTNKKVADLIVESRVRGSGGDVAKKITVKLYGRGVVGKSEKRLGSESTQYYRRAAGQFIYSKLDFLNGAFGQIPETLDGYESTLDLPAFDFLPGIDARWFLHFVSREDFYLGHLGLANGGRKARRVNPLDLLRVTILVPELAEQKAIANVLGAAQAEINNFTKQLSLLREQKTALMSQLLTGKRRVLLPAPFVERAA